MTKREIQIKNCIEEGYTIPCIMVVNHKNEYYLLDAIDSVFKARLKNKEDLKIAVSLTGREAIRL